MFEGTPPTAASFLRGAARRLVGVSPSPDLDARCILAHVLGCSPTAFLAWPERGLHPDQATAAQALLARRATGEPVAYLVGKKEFYGRDFFVSPDVLIPRPDTELLVDAALEDMAGSGRFADLGVGSGCILATLLAGRPCWQGIGMDRAGNALAVAKKNCLRHNIMDRALLARADFSLPFFLPGSLDIIVSNPPYIGSAEYETLMDDVRLFEPKSALVPDGPAMSEEIAGFEPYPLLESVARHALRKGGRLFLEMGADQGNAMRRLFASRGRFWKDVRIERDLGGRERLLVAKRDSAGLY